MMPTREEMAKNVRVVIVKRPGQNIVSTTTKRPNLSYAANMQKQPVLPATKKMPLNINRKKIVITATGLMMPIKANRAKIAKSAITKRAGAPKYGLIMTSQTSRW